MNKKYAVQFDSNENAVKILASLNYTESDEDDTMFEVEMTNDEAETVGAVDSVTYMSEL